MYLPTIGQRLMADKQAAPENSIGRRDLGGALAGATSPRVSRNEGGLPGTVSKRG